MASTTTKSLFLKGLVDSLPFLLVASPFGLLFGVLSAEAGLNVLEALAFSLAVFAGAAQFTALQLLQENTPLLIVVLSDPNHSTRSHDHSQLPPKRSPPRRSVT